MMDEITSASMTDGESEKKSAAAGGGEMSRLYMRSVGVLLV